MYLSPEVEITGYSGIRGAMVEVRWPCRTMRCENVATTTSPHRVKQPQAIRDLNLWAVFLDLPAPFHRWAV